MSIKNKILLILILFCLTVFAQSKQNTNVSNKGFFFINYFNFNDSTQFITINFPASNLIFNKIGNKFVANYSLEISVFDSKKNLLKTLLDQQALTLSANEYDNKNFFFINLLFKSSDLSQANSLELNLSQENNILSKANFALTKSNFFIGNLTDSTFILSTLGKNIPFSEKNFDILLDVTFYKDTIIFEQQNKKLSFTNLRSFQFTDPMQQDNNIILKKSQIGKKYYIIKSVNQLFYEGIVKATSKSISTNIRVIWYEKPKSLRNLDYAIDKLALVFNNKDIEKIKNNDTTLISFYTLWKKFDPDTNTSYNPAIKEFYNRVDYAITNFSSLSVKDGSETDMGKIYIIYGQPTNKNRYLLPNKKTVEIWEYKNLKKIFKFEDNSGLGNFKLVEE